MHHDGMSTVNVPLHVVSYAALECEKQRSGERSVEWMIKGWLYARRRRNRNPIFSDVLALGAIVEPRKAASGLRSYGVRVGYDVKMHHEAVPAALMRLLDAVPPTDDLPARQKDIDEWYRQYEEIHPFGDGNGRTGSLLWNWLGNQLDWPSAPPDFWTPDPVMLRDAIYRRVEGDAQ